LRSPCRPRRFLVQQSTRPPRGQPRRVLRRPPGQRPRPRFPLGQNVKSLIFLSLPRVFWNEVMTGNVRKTGPALEAHFQFLMWLVHGAGGREIPAHAEVPRRSRGSGRPAPPSWLHELLATTFSSTFSMFCCPEAHLACSCDTNDSILSANRA